MVVVGGLVGCSGERPLGDVLLRQVEAQVSSQSTNSHGGGVTGAAVCSVKLLLQIVCLKEDLILAVSVCESDLEGLSPSSSLCWGVDVAAPAASPRSSET